MEGKGRERSSQKKCVCVTFPKIREELSKWELWELEWAWVKKGRKKNPKKGKFS